MVRLSIVSASHCGKNGWWLGINLIWLEQMNKDFWSKRMKYIIVLFTLALSGCYQTVNINDIETAIKACNGIENVNSIDAYASGTEVAECKNRTRFSLDEKVWNK